MYFLANNSDNPRSKLLNAEMIKTRDDVLELEQFCAVSNN